MADIEDDPHSTIAGQLSDLAKYGKAGEAMALQRELDRLSKEPDQTGLR